MLVVPCNSLFLRRRPGGLEKYLARMRRLKPTVAPDEAFDFYDMEEPDNPVVADGIEAGGETVAGGEVANDDEIGEIEAEPFNYSETA